MTGLEPTTSTATPPLAVPDDSATAVPRLSTAAPSSSSLAHPQDALGDDAQNRRQFCCAFFESLQNKSNPHIKQRLLFGRGDRARTDDIQFPKLARYQLRYTPINIEFLCSCKLAQGRSVLLTLLRCPKLLLPPLPKGRGTASAVVG